jgi:hypothetical protein
MRAKLRTGGRFFKPAVQTRDFPEFVRQHGCQLRFVRIN